MKVRISKDWDGNPDTGTIVFWPNRHRRNKYGEYEIEMWIVRRFCATPKCPALEDGE